MDANEREFDELLDRVLIGGREPANITIVAYDPAWLDRYAAECRRIGAALGEAAFCIEHIGSTAVPGLAAKPIIDVLVSVDEVENETAFRPKLEAAGYILRVREPGHRMFRPSARDVHIHIWPAQSPEVRRYLLFRNRLRSSAADRALYEATKRELARRSWTDMNHYAAAKSEIIARILQHAADAC